MFFDHMINQPLGEAEMDAIATQAPVTVAWVDRELREGRVVHRQHIKYNPDDPADVVTYKSHGLIRDCFFNPQIPVK